MSKKRTVSYTLGATLDGPINVTHEIYDHPEIIKTHKKARLQKLSTKSKQKPPKKGIHSKRN